MHFIFQILVGSHKVGRIDHVKIGDQVGADLDRLSHVEKFCPLMHVEVGKICLTRVRRHDITDDHPQKDAVLSHVISMLV